MAKKVKMNEHHKRQMKELMRDFIGILIGCSIAGIGLNAFLIPNQLASGGVSGLGIVLLYVLGIPVGLTILAFNIPLLIAEGKIMGLKFTIRTVFGAIMYSALIEVFSFVPDVTGDYLLSAIYGGIFVGIGMGIVFRNRGTTGGTALAAQLLCKFTGLSMGQAIVAFDMVVIAISAVFFGAEIALYALIALFVTSRVIDMVQQGFRQEKAAFIISDMSKEISDEILNQMGRGATKITARGSYTDEDRDIILTVVNRTEITKVKYLVYSLDPSAFVIITNASEVTGEGFQIVDPAEL